MSFHQPFQMECFHSCDKHIGFNVLNGKDQLNPSLNNWDWLGPGVYFWEQNPNRALDYALENASGKQYNKQRIKTPFVLGAIVELGNCLNLVETTSISLLQRAYHGLREFIEASGNELPKNDGAKRELDCAVIKYIHQTRKLSNLTPYDTVRSSFLEGEEVYPGASFTKRSHIQVCVLNQGMIKGYFLPRPLGKFNPYI